MPLLSGAIQRLSLMNLLIFLLSLVFISKAQHQQSQIEGKPSGLFQKLKGKWDTFVSRLDDRFPQLHIGRQLEILQWKIDLLTSSLKFPPNKYFMEVTYHSLVYKDVYYPKEHVLPGEFYNTHYGSFAKAFGRREDMIRRPTHLGGQVISNVEVTSMEEVRYFISLLKIDIENDHQATDYSNEGREHDLNFIRSLKISSYDEISAWLWSCTDVDIIRFLRRQSNDSRKAFVKIVAHAKWRISYPNGADHIVRENNYKNNIKLHEEVFWLDHLDKNDCPTVIVRALLHDGNNYDEIPQRFTNFLVLLLEQSRDKLNVGSEKMACLILDRFPLVSTDGASKNQEMFDLSVIPNIVSLLSNIVETMQDNYPEIFESITVTPASWFFQTCFRITSKVFEKKIRDRFHLIPDNYAAIHLNNLFPGELSQQILPEKNVVEGNDISHNANINSKSVEGDSIFENTWFSNLITIMLFETSVYFIWQAKEYMSCYYLHDIRRCTVTGTGKNFQRVRSRDVMTF